MGREFLKGLRVTAVPVNPRLGLSAFKQFEKLLLILIFFFHKCSWKMCLVKCRSPALQKVWDTLLQNLVLFGGKGGNQRESVGLHS